MHPNRFDQLSRVFARQGNRRNVVAGGLGLATAAVANRAMAQEATPAVTPSGDPHPSAIDPAVETEFLFVQPFDSGMWAPKPDEDGISTFTLSGTDANTIYFSDRPSGLWAWRPPSSSSMAWASHSCSVSGSMTETLLARDVIEIP